MSYLPWVENHKDSGDGLLRRISGRAAAMIIDDYPTTSPLGSEACCKNHLCLAGGGRFNGHPTYADVRKVLDSTFVQEVHPKKSLDSI